MKAESERRIAFAQTRRLRAASTCSPFQREHFLITARFSDCEAELVEHSRDCIAESKNLIARRNVAASRAGDPAAKLLQQR